MVGGGKEGEINPENGFRVHRPWKHFMYNYGLKVDEESWFGKNMTPILTTITKGSDDLRFNRLVGMSMLTEAWDETEFRQEVGRLGADDLDRLQLIIWLQHWLSITGMMTFEKLLGMHEGVDGGAAKGWCAEMARKTWEVEPNFMVAEKTRKLAAAGKMVGIFHGTFAPPTTTHLWCATNYRQYCDALIVAIDSDELAVARKGPGRERYPFASKYAVWKAFPDVVDFVAQVPTNFYEDGKYVEKNIVEYYKSLGVGIVFFNPNEPGREVRERQIRAAGAVSFTELDDFMFSSSDLMEMQKAGQAMKVLGRK